MQPMCFDRPRSRLLEPVSRSAARMVEAHATRAARSFISAHQRSLSWMMDHILSELYSLNFYRAQYEQNKVSVAPQYARRCSSPIDRFRSDYRRDLAPVVRLFAGRACLNRAGRMDGLGSGKTQQKAEVKQRLSDPIRRKEG